MLAFVRNSEVRGVGETVRSLGWCMTGHHQSCPQTTHSGMSCGCDCHAEKAPPTDGLRNMQVPRNLSQSMQDPATSDLSGRAHVRTISFALDGVSYEVDLNEEQDYKLRTELAPYLRAARHRKNKTTG